MNRRMHTCHFCGERRLCDGDLCDPCRADLYRDMPPVLAHRIPSPSRRLRPCSWPDCPKTGHSACRGLCRGHYRAILDKIRAGLASWQTFTDLALPPAPAEIPPELRCIIPDCPGQRKSRGLCHTCYMRALTRIKTGLTNWPELEAAGVALAPAPVGTAWRHYPERKP